MNQILYIPGNNQKEKINQNYIKHQKTQKIFLLPLILCSLIGISSYKIYAFVLDLQENQNINYIANCNIEYNVIENTQQVMEENNVVNNQEIEIIINENDENKQQQEKKAETSSNNIKQATTAKATTSTYDSIKSGKYKASNGKTYTAIAVLNIPSLNIEYPVLSSTSEELLKVSLNKYWGAEPNEVGNMCIVGHNYEDSRFFGKLNQLKNGAIIKITDLSGRTLEYKVYDSYVVGPYDTACTSQLTNGETEITLITCHSNGTKRLVVKARA